MPHAIWNDTVIADSDDTIVIEGNHYFPRESVDHGLLVESATTSRCWWKGKAAYVDIVVDDEVNPDAGWHYPAPTRAARRIAGYCAFGRGVRIEL